MSKRRNTQLAGHGLWREGMPYMFNPETRAWEEVRPGWEGCGLCKCGAYSPVLPSNSKRRQWHRDHKQLERMAASPERAGGDGHVSPAHHR